MSKKNARKEYHLMDQRRARGIPRRIEELGVLNDEFMQLTSAEKLDKNKMKILAQKYFDRGMKATALKVLNEAGLDMSALRTWA